MPLKVGQDANGVYVKYGDTGSPYYFDPKSTRSVAVALNKAKRQRTAIKASQTRQAFSLLKEMRKKGKI